MTASYRVTELDIRRAERAANKATVAYSVHERYCSLWKHDLTCPTCTHLWALAEHTRRFWESLARQQMPAERVAEGIA